MTGADPAPADETGRVKGEDLEGAIQKSLEEYGHAPEYRNLLRASSKSRHRKRQAGPSRPRGELSMDDLIMSIGTVKQPIKIKSVAQAINSNNKFYEAPELSLQGFFEQMEELNVGT